YLPLERVLADPPEVVLASGEERMLTHPALRQLDGVRYERFDSSLLFCGGPTVARAVERLAEIRRAADEPQDHGALPQPRHPGESRDRVPTARHRRRAPRALRQRSDRRVRRRRREAPAFAGM